MKANIPLVCGEMVDIQVCNDNYCFPENEDGYIMIKKFNYDICGCFSFVVPGRACIFQDC